MTRERSRPPLGSGGRENTRTRDPNGSTRLGRCAETDCKLARLSWSVLCGKHACVMAFRTLRESDDELVREWLRQGKGAA